MSIKSSIPEYPPWKLILKHEVKNKNLVEKLDSQIKDLLRILCT